MDKVGIFGSRNCGIKRTDSEERFQALTSQIGNAKTRNCQDRVREVCHNREPNIKYRYDLLYEWKWVLTELTKENGELSQTKLSLATITAKMSHPLVKGESESDPSQVKSHWRKYLQEIVRGELEVSHNNELRMSLIWFTSQLNASQVVRVS